MARPKKERAEKYEEKVKLNTNLKDTLKLFSKAAKKKAMSVERLTPSTDSAENAIQKRLDEKRK